MRTKEIVERGEGKRGRGEIEREGEGRRKETKRAKRVMEREGGERGDRKIGEG